MSDNPFGVQNPEHVDAEYIAHNFVDVFTDFPRLKERGNTFIHGARGTGKSMLLRSLEPRVMLLRADGAKELTDLPFLAVHVPLRAIEFATPELARYKGYEATAIGEHLLVMQIMFRVATLLSSLSSHIDQEAASIYGKRFDELYEISGGKLDEGLKEQVGSVTVSPFSRIARVCEIDLMKVRQYYTRFLFGSGNSEYTGALTGFLDFLIPLAVSIQELGGLPKVPLFVMLDDADNLPVDMQRVLNSWVSTRSSHAICLKITTQLAYATLRTVDNRTIESPHDYAEVNLSAVYTTENDNYSDRVRQIIQKRLTNAAIFADVDTFFPKDDAQARRLDEIEAEIEAEHAAREPDADGQHRGAKRVRDERIRYAVPRLMRERTGSSRSAHTYSYAGFKSLVDLSSGVVRWFLEPASRMYDRVVSGGDSKVTSIPVKIQDDVIRDWATEFVDALSAHVGQAGQSSEDSEAAFDADASLHAYGHETEMYNQLRNLIESLGRIFRERLLNEKASEQRIISIVLRDTPSRELNDVLQLGVRLGYLQRADNAAKEALGGRRPRYILSRRLGPYYKLDVSGYAAHLSVKATDLEIALNDPATFVKTRLKQTDGDSNQFTLDLK